MRIKDIRQYFKLKKYVKKSEKKLKSSGFIIDKKNHLLETPTGITLKYEGASALTTLSEFLEIFFIEEYSFYTNNSESIVVFDVGVNMAASTLYFANKHNVKQVYAFEPFIPTYKKALENIHLNPRLEHKIKLFNYGLGYDNKILEIPYEEKSSGCMSTTFDVFNLNKDNCKNTDSVETVTIEDAYHAISEILNKKTNEKVILKIDTEGAEFEIIKSLDENRYLENFNLIMLEYHFNEPDELIERLTNNGFIVRKQVSDTNKKIGFLYAAKLTN